MKTQIRASHILLMYKGASHSDSMRSKQEAEVAANVLRSELAGGADFANLAQRHSDCPSGEDGGDLGYFTRGAMVPEFEEAAFGLAPGEVSDVVETAFGFHLIQRTD
jgi:peptidyl-prolyl cis-trans isomerase C/peptidyl-prolyl cis-trans isomerase SurA